MYKILFLDVTGVLVPGDTPSLTPNLYCLKQLERILLRVPQSRVVFSSTLREYYPLKVLSKRILKTARTKVIGMTPIIDGTFHRGTEIYNWLFKNSCDGFVILDDSRDVYPFDDHLVRVNGETGLTKWAANKAIEILMRDNEFDGKLSSNFKPPVERTYRFEYSHSMYNDYD